MTGKAQTSDAAQVVGAGHVPQKESGRLESVSAKIHVDFPEYHDPPAEPLALALDWVAQAVALGVREPKAIALATADAAGLASTRIVVLSSFDERGLVFATHSSSQKGRELTENPWASGIFYWRETGQQLMLSGLASALGEAENDALWNARPIPLHAMSTASQQSEPLADPQALRDEAERYAASGRALPRPKRFVAYRLAPAIVEFWCARPDRLHYRLRYDLTADGWRYSRLQP